MFKIGIAALTAGMALAGAASAGDIAGLWRTTDGDQVQIVRCGDSVCVHIVTSHQLTADPGSLDVKNKNPALRSRPIKGLLIMQSFQPSGDSWVGGALYDPRNGQTYKGSLDPIGSERLKVTGCIIAPMCGTQTWVRLK